MKYTLIITSIIFPFLLQAQEIHSFGELFKIIEESEMVYELGLLEETIQTPDRSEHLNFNNVYRVETDSAIYTNYYDTLSTEGKINYDLAESYFTDSNLDSALYYYNKVRTTDPGYFTIMTYMGQIYGSIGYLNLARDKYKEVIELNYIDYLAHWLLADIYRMQESYDSALREITIASVLNRNNPRLKKLQFEIYEHAKLNTDEWYFTPQYKLEELSPDEIGIRYADGWLPYAMCEAVWEYEPGYKESMGVADDDVSSLKYKECLVNFYIGLLATKPKIRKERPIKILKKAIEDDMLTKFIMYELFLPEYPQVAYQLSEELINDIADYVITLRHARKIK